MKLNKGLKGQASIEYLATYGWAILTITVVGIIVWQMGLFDLPPEDPGCRGFSQVRPIDWIYTPDPDVGLDSEFNVVIVNEANTKLLIPANGVRIYIENEGLCTISDPDVDANMSAGAKLQMNISHCPGSVGKEAQYRAQINISYRNMASGMDRESAGICWGTTE
jgi:hypothetical protein